jgi:two-component system sensor histidine kinase UhpB
VSTVDGGDTLRSIAARVRELSLENEKLFRELVSAERRFRSLSRSVWRVQEDERRRLARELHDGLGQVLAALKNHLEGARGADGNRVALEMVAQALADTRELSRLLRPAVLDDLGLEPALRWLVRSVGERFGIEVNLVVHGLDDRIENEVETLAFRIVQEALTNVAKHSGAKRARVEVDCTGGRLTIRVSDPGKGFDPPVVLDVQREAGVGLRGMRDRAELFGGSMRIESQAGAGTRIEVAVPLDAPDLEAAP